MSAYVSKTVLILLVFIAVSCNPANPDVSQDLEDSFRKSVHINNLNVDFLISVELDDGEELENGSDIRVRLENISRHEILFSSALGNELYMIENNSWVQVQNLNKYYGTGSPLILKSEHQIDNKITSGVRPFLPEAINLEGYKAILRILMVGELLEDGARTGTLTGAYADVFIRP